jgi:hypothetical protein
MFHKNDDGVLAEDNHGSLYAGARHFYAHSMNEDENLKYDEKKRQAVSLC